MHLGVHNLSSSWVLCANTMLTAVDPQIWLADALGRSAETL